MKKIILLIILCLGIYPSIYKGEFRFSDFNVAYADDFGSEDPNTGDIIMDLPQDAKDALVNLLESQPHLGVYTPEYPPEDNRYQQGDATLKMEVGDAVATYQYKFERDDDGKWTGNGTWELVHVIGDLPQSITGITGGGGDEGSGGGGTGGDDSPPGGDDPGGGDGSGDTSNASTTITADPFFQYLNEGTIANDMNKRIQNPFLVSQESTGLCGMACISKVLIEKDPSGYRDLVSRLFWFGDANYKGVYITAKNSVSPNVLNYMVPLSPSWPEYNGKQMAQADFILMCSLKNTQNNFDPYLPGRDFVSQSTGITFPGSMTSYMTSLLQLQYVRDDTNLYYSINYSDLVSIDNAATANIPGIHPRTIFLFVDAAMLGNSPPLLFSTPNHWIQFLPGTLVIDTVNNRVKFDAYSWGGTEHINVSITDFNRYYYGSVSGY
jgi:hypothetical protein